MPTTTVTSSLLGYINNATSPVTDWLTQVRNASTGNASTLIPGFQISTFGIGVRLNTKSGITTGQANRTFIFFGNIDTAINGGTVSSATLKIYGTNSFNLTTDSIIVSGSAFGGDGSVQSLNNNDFPNLDFSSPYSSKLTTWNQSGYNSFTLNETAISDINTNGYLNCVLIDEVYDFQGVNPSDSTNLVNDGTFDINSGIFVELVLTYTTAPPQVSTTQSIEISPDDLTSATPVTYSIDNPLNYSSYVALETTRNADGFYDTTSPQNISGSFSLGNGIIDIVNDNYKVGVIVAPGGGELVFTPANSVVSSSLLLRGTGWSGVEYPSCPPENGIGLYLRQSAGDGLFLYILIRLDSRNGSNSYSSVFSPNYLINYYLDYNSSLKKWEVLFFDETTKLGDSSNLISSNWSNSVVEGVEAFSTTCGYPNLPNYCVEVPNIDDMGAPDQKINVSPLYFIEINPNEPVGWWGQFAGFISYWAPIAGAPDDGWVIQYDSYSAFLPGGSIDSLPLGEITLTSTFDPSDTITITISAGVCSL